MLKIPHLVRLSDGASFSPGTVVNFGLKVYIIRHVYISNDLLKYYVMVVDVSNSDNDNGSYIDEEIMLNLDEITVMDNWQLSERLTNISKNVATDSFSELLGEICHYPMHVKKVIRRHALVSAMRRNIQFFLLGHEMVGNLNLGLVDLDLDPHILSLSSKRPRLIYHIEESDDETFDQLLGCRWDMVDLSKTIDGYRIILTLEIEINSMGEICLTAHGATCSETPSQEGDKEYRQQYLRFSSSNIQSVNQASDNSATFSRLCDSEGNRDNSIQWESFNVPNAAERSSTPVLQSSSAENTTPTVSRILEKVQVIVDPASSPDIKKGPNISDSGSSRAPSRCFSIRSHSTAASAKPRLQGIFQGQITNVNNNPQCPFPDDWQYGTVPEVVTNDEDID